MGLKQRNDFSYLFTSYGIYKVLEASFELKVFSICGFFVENDGFWSIKGESELAPQKALFDISTWIK